ncbi:MAG: hypothetical protein IJH63_03350 [Methanobrevibacter sp.]|nr:hypothetical protein [Methanobrevibacter sp.]
MYEIRKWIIKPVLKEVIESDINFQALEESVAEIAEANDFSTEDEFFEDYEIEELETGLLNGDVLISL